MESLVVYLHLRGSSPSGSSPSGSMILFLVGIDYPNIPYSQSG